MANQHIGTLNAEDHFSNGTQAAITIVDLILQKHGCTSPNLNDYLYFYNVLLKLILSRVDIDKTEMSQHLREAFKTASVEGITMCEVMMSSKMNIKEDKDQALQTVMHSIRGGNNINAELFIDVAKEIQLLGMANDGLWKLHDNFEYPPALEKEMETILNKLIDEKIKEANQADVKYDNHESPEIAFLICVAINTGIVMGYVSVLYHQSIDEMIDNAIKQIIEVRHHKDAQEIKKLNLASKLKSSPSPT